jgi:hypothetical protein
LLKKRGSALYQQLEPSLTTLLGCLPPHETVEGEEVREAVKEFLLPNTTELKSIRFTSLMDI